jgi:DNA-binding beta-propeller fold protein YncE
VYGSGARAHVRGIIVGVLGAAALTACASGGSGQQVQQGSPDKPQQVLPAPKGLLAAAQPQPNGTMWALAGDGASKGLFDLSLATGKGAGSISVSNAAQSVTESLAGVVGLALGTGRTGALELLNGSTGKVIRTIPLGAPARDVVVASDGTTFYALDGNSKSASVTVVNSRNGDGQGTVPVPVNTVSIAPDAQGSSFYALQPDGTVSQVAVVGGKIMASFATGPGGRSLALSPDGTTLYVLKDASASTANVAEVDLATESVQRTLPAPASSMQVLVSADGTQLYQLVGTSAYGNIQVFAS